MLKSKLRVFPRGMAHRHGFVGIHDWHMCCELTYRDSLDRVPILSPKEKIMLVKLYWSVWAAFGLVAMVLFLTGNISPMTIVVLGFVAFGLIFLGMMNVLPSIAAHPASSAETHPELLGSTSESPIPTSGFAGVPSMRKAAHSAVQARAH